MSHRNKIVRAVARALTDSPTAEGAHFHAAPFGHGYVCRDASCRSPNRHTEI
jgi:hypothetical protein